MYRNQKKRRKKKGRTGESPSNPSLLSIREGKGKVSRFWMDVVVCPTNDMLASLGDQP